MEKNLLNSIVYFYLCIHLRSNNMLIFLKGLVHYAVRENSNNNKTTVTYNKTTLTRDTEIL